VAETTPFFAQMPVSGKEQQGTRIKEQGRILVLYPFAFAALPHQYKGNCRYGKNRQRA
jgi:hypothetical protein